MKELRDNLPQAFSAENAARGMEKWREMQVAGAPEPLLAAIFGNSPYLSHLLLQYSETVRDLASLGADEAYAKLVAELASPPAGEGMELARHLRIAKGRLALLAALADIGGLWSLERVMAALSEFAERCLVMAVDTLLTKAHERGEIQLAHPDAPSRESGVIVLAMGKLGARELNYSSDIDL
ncbi:MAG: glutamine-synthetase adenylyltransferase, partial [Pseudomonadota bacterium]|nr:glutamine-synthetase adenylyltransferase [Pseudomonadota bacterium]